MQKWEHCVVGPIKYNWSGHYLNLSRFFSNNSQQSLPINEERIVSDDDLAKTVARLGDEGWEMVGCENIRLGIFRYAHLLYFKRPKQG